MCDSCKQEFIEKQKLAAFSDEKFLSDRNLAFKCNWMDTDFETPCTAAGRRFNIYKAKHVWCSQPGNQCARLEQGETFQLEAYPCYESGIFHNWEFGAGIVQRGERAGQGRHIHHQMVGKLALLTTRGPGEQEADRSIFGYLRIKDFYSDELSDATHVVGDLATSLKIPKDSRLRFWAYYRNKKTPAMVWSTGLFRYVSDAGVRKYLQAQLDELLKKEHTEEKQKVEHVLGFYSRKG